MLPCSNLLLQMCAETGGGAAAEPPEIGGTWRVLAGIVVAV